MSLLGKRGSKQGEIHTRRQYVDHSLNFLNWVNQLGFEKSFLGRFAYYLDTRFGIRRILLLFLFSLGLSFLLFYDFEIMGEYSIGEMAPVDVKSPVSLVIVDEVATEEKRLAAEKTLPLVLDYEPQAFEAHYNRVYKAFRLMRNEVGKINWPKSVLRREEMVKDFVRHKSKFVEALERDVPDHVFEWLTENRFSVQVENILIRAISKWSTEVIVDMSDSALIHDDRPVTVRELSTIGRGREFNVKMGRVRNMRDTSQFSLEEVRGYSSLGPMGRQNVLQLAHLLLISNATLNKQEFTERQKKARDSVLPVQISIKKNQTIVAAGSAIQPIHLTIMNEIKNIRSEQRVDFLSLFSAILFVVLAVVFFAFLHKYSRGRIRVETKDILVMGVITTLVVILSRLFLFLTDAVIVEKYGQAIPTIALMVAAPIAAGPMLVGLLIYSAEIVWVFTVFLAVVVGVMTDMNLPVFVVTIIGGIAAAQGVLGCTKRNDIYMAGLRTGVVNAIVVMLVYALTHMGDSDLLRGVLYCAVGGFIGGLFSSFVAMTFVPLLESAFNYTTDIKLLELSSLNHPLMQEMMMKAPGTYHHCMNVGSMSDAAAKEIGANPLLSKVMAYYHDIGKTEHAQYFAENQRPGVNAHDHISPHMSKTILVAHVKDGAEMAIQHKLGKPIVDGILQHHGTTLISFFYNKALEEQDADVTGEIEESDFRYPGPKPQFKESAIVMLADSIEATARSLEEPTPGRLNSIVENIVESKFMDGQLDECDLSISDLATIKETFKRLLLSMYHHRIDYPHMKDGKLLSVPQKKNATGKRA